MARLTLSLLGPFQATLDGEPAIGFESDKVRALLAYLAVEADRPHSRDKLAGLLWPEWPDRDARNNLRYALSNLRQVIKDREATPPFLHISRQSIQFNGDSDAWNDVITVDRLLKAPRPTVQELEETVDLYRGEFLEGFSIGDSVPFEEWVLFKREQLNRQMLSALRHLAATYEERGEYSRALPYAWRQVELEPWQEQAHRQLMRLLALNGQRGAALAQYETCRQALAEELDVEPAQETTRLYEQIRDGTLDLGRAGEPGTGEGRVPLPPRAAEAAPAPPAPAQRPSAGWRTLGRRLIIVVGVLLLLAIATMEAITLFGSEGGLFGAASRETPSPLPLAEPPDGKSLHPCEGVTPPQICVHKVQTDQVAQVTHALEFETIGRLSWSPDGDQIVFNAGSHPVVTPHSNHRLYIINADGSNMRQLTGDDTSDTEPVWSPDGQWIAFNRRRELWIIRPDGSEAQRLFGESGKPCVGDLTWSPDGQQIAFVGHGCEALSYPEEVWVINRDGTDSRAVYSFDPRPKSAAVLWSADGQAILCVYEYKGGETQFFLVNASGAGEAGTLDRLPYWWHPNFWPQWGREE
jgi:DNA-binding SARP family transcriptional activator